jgi:hypothetical protein
VPSSPEPHGLGELFRLLPLVPFRQLPLGSEGSE